MDNFLLYSNNSAIWKESGRRIRKRRKALGIKSRDAFLEQIRKYEACSLERIKNIESGKDPIKGLAILGAICTVLQCDPGYITCQCDTLRKEYADPVQRFGLSEQSFHVLEHSPGKTGTAITANFILENKEVALALYSILKLHHDKEISEPAETLIDFLNDKEMEEKIKSGEMVAFVKGNEYSLHHRLDLVKDDNKQYTISQKQATFIAEQQLIDEIRKALERTDKTAPGSYPTLYPTLYPKTPTD